MMPAAAMPTDEQEAARMEIQNACGASNQRALANMAIFPTIMLVGYLGSIFYFKMTGRYKVQVLSETG